MVAGCLAKAGYYMGVALVPPRESNPKGFFEDLEINNEINEPLLAQVVHDRVRFMGKEFFRYRPTQGQRWLAKVPLTVKINCPLEIAKRIRRHVSREPYCFKDPRFSYTLPVWRTYLKDTVFVCVFRDPGTTAASILKECRDEEYLESLSINVGRALGVWEMMYRHIVEKHQYEGEWLFLHYDQIVNGQGLERLARFTDAHVDHCFPDNSLRRSFSNTYVPKRILSLYEQLCNLAKYDCKVDGQSGL
jgi:hypothetical protein